MTCSALEGFDLATLMQDVVTFGIQPRNNELLQSFFQLYWRLIDVRKCDKNFDLAAVLQFFVEVARDLEIFDHTITQFAKKTQELIKKDAISVNLDKLSSVEKEFDRFFSRLTSLHVLLARIGDKNLATENVQVQKFASWRFAICILIQRSISELAPERRGSLFNAEKYEMLLKKCGGVDFMDETRLFFNIVQQTRQGSIPTVLVDTFYKQLSEKQKEIAEDSSSLTSSSSSVVSDLTSDFSDSDFIEEPEKSSHPFGAIGEPLSSKRGVSTEETSKRVVASEETSKRVVATEEAKVAQVVVEAKKPSAEKEKAVDVDVKKEAKKNEDAAKKNVPRKKSKHYRAFPYRKVVDPALLQQNWRRLSDGEQTVIKRSQSNEEIRKKSQTKTESPKQVRVEKTTDAQPLQKKNSKKNNGAAQYSAVWLKR